MPLSEEQVNENIKKALEFQRGLVEEDPEPMAHCWIVNEKEKVIMIAFSGDCFSSPKAKNELAIFMLAKMVEHRGVAIFMHEVFVAEAMAPSAEEARRKLPPNFRDLPEDQRSDALLCVVNQMGQQAKTMLQRFKRGADGKVTWEKEVWSMSGQENRFAFDLRKESMVDRIRKALEDDVLVVDGAVKTAPRIN